MHYAGVVLLLFVSMSRTSLADPVPRASQPTANIVACIESDQLCNNAVAVPIVEPIPTVKCSDNSDSCITATSTNFQPIQILEGEPNNEKKEDNASLVPTPPDTATKFTIPTIILISVLAVLGIAYGIYKFQTISSAPLPHIRERLSYISDHLPTISTIPIRKYLPIPTSWRMNENTLVRWAQEDMGLLDITDEDFERGIRSSSDSSSSPRYPKYEFEIEEYDEVKSQKKRFSPSAVTSFASRGGFANYGSAWK